MVTHDVYLQTAHSPPDGADDLRLYSGGAVQQVSVTESGAGAETITAAATMTVSDSGSGAETTGLANDQAIAESGSGSETPSMQAQVAASDSGTGAETSVAVAITLNISDSGTGAETPSLTISLTLSDTGSGIDSSLIVQSLISAAETCVGTETSISLAMSVTIAETSAGSEAPNLVTSFTVTDSATGSEVVTPVLWTISQDQGMAAEAVSVAFGVTVAEETLGAEFAWRTKPTVPMVDSFEFPHVLSMRMTDEAAVSDKKILKGELPKRKIVGKPGRVVEIEGWSDSQSDFDAMEALVDGTVRTFYHPSGDSFGVLVTAFNQDARVEDYGRRGYRAMLMETHQQ